MQSLIHRLAIVAVLTAITMQAYAGSYLILRPTNTGSWANDLVTQIDGTGLISASEISHFDTKTATPTLAMLQAYDAVITMGNDTPIDPVTLGDTLADYVDLGGGVITMQWGYTAGYLAGRFTGEAYSAFPDSTPGNYATTWNLDQTSIQEPGRFPSKQIFDGVDSLAVGTTGLIASPFAAGVNPGAQLLASWDSGVPAVAFNMPSGEAYYSGYVIGINMFPGSSAVRVDYGWDVTTDGGVLLANSLLFTIVPEPASFGLIAAGAALVMMRRRK